MPFPCLLPVPLYLCLTLFPNTQTAVREAALSESSRAGGCTGAQHTWLILPGDSVLQVSQMTQEKTLKLQQWGQDICPVHLLEGP